MQVTEKQKYGINTFVGLAGGRAAYIWLPNALKKGYLSYYYVQSDKVTPEQNKEYWNAAEKIRSQHALLKDSVTITNINMNNFEQVATEIIEKHREHNTKKKKNLKNISLTKGEKIYKERMQVYAMGKNACYITNLSRVLVNKDKMSVTICHELGHAINAKCSGFKNMLARTRSRALKPIPFIFAASMLIPADNKENPVDNKYYRAMATFKKYSGLLISACMLPMVAEEGMASLNAKKIGKDVLSPELYKKMNNLNLKAFGSYFVAMVAAGLGITFANYVKDKITGSIPESVLKRKETADTEIEEEKSEKQENVPEQTAEENDNQELIEK